MAQTILIVEDNEDLLECIAEEVIHLGRLPLCARSVAEARALLAERDDIGALLVDLELGGDLNGEQLAQYAQALRPTLHVIIATGHDARQLSAEGRDRYPLLRKPYSLAELAHALDLP